MLSNLLSNTFNVLSVNNCQTRIIAPTNRLLESEGKMMTCSSTCLKMVLTWVHYLRKFRKQKQKSYGTTIKRKLNTEEKSG